MGDTDLISINDYSELKFLCWDTIALEISKYEAFNRYINSWRHVNESELSQPEKLLIQELTTTYGRGYFFPRSFGKAAIDKAFLEVAMPEADIKPEHLNEFIKTVEYPGYPGMRNGVQYYWKSDYENYLSALVI